MSSLIATNKNATRHYHLSDKYDAGIVLVGTEAKSIRQGGVHINDAYAIIENEQVYIINMNVTPYSHGNRFNHDPVRRRKLLLHKNEIRKISGSVVEKGFTLVPTKLFWSKGKVKVELAIAKGKNQGDQRQDIKKRDANREIHKAMKRKVSK